MRKVTHKAVINSVSSVVNGVECLILAQKKDSVYHTLVYILTPLRRWSYQP